MDKLTAMRSACSAFGEGEPRMGLAPAGELVLSLYLDSASVPRMAKVRPFVRVVNDRLSFFMNDTQVAYLSNNKLYVTQAEILTKLIIGRFAFEPQENGNLSLVYNG